MSPHRTPGDVMPDGPTPLQKGPALKCPACKLEAIGDPIKVLCRGEVVSIDVGRSKSSPIPMPRACVPNNRIKLGWFKRCAIPGEHLHETCNGCGLRWITAFAEGT